MNPRRQLIYSKTSYSKILQFFCVLFFLYIIYAGFQPKGYHLKNDIETLKTESGVRFGPQGLAFTKKPDPDEEQALFTRSQITLELAFRPALAAHSDPVFIFSLWNDNTSHYISLCQWRALFLILKHPKFSLKNAPKLGIRLPLNQAHHLVITEQCGKGVSLYLNGKFVDSSQNLSLVCSPETHPNRLVLGSSPQGNFPWSGDIFRFAIENHKLDSAEIEKRYADWKASLYYPNAPAKSPVPSWAGLLQHPFGTLEVPETFRAPQRHFLLWPWGNHPFTAAYFLDMFMNIAGFIPFGFLLSFCLIHWLPRKRKWGPWIATLTGGGLSLLFECAQYFLPTRSSQLMDFILNLLGTALGVILFESFSSPEKIRSEINSENLQKL